MLRFVLNFFIFGFIFFLIWKFQPNWIEILRTWAEAVYNVVAHLASVGVDKVKELSSSIPAGGKS